MTTNELARIAGLIGEPARTGMLVALMDGRAHTAEAMLADKHVQSHGVVHRFN